MTVTPIKPAPAEPARVKQPESRNRVKQWFLSHWKSIVLVCILMVPVGLASWLNLKGFPGTVNDDEGTYVDQAWAVLYQGHLAHYTYWYDHPPLGWMQISGYAWLTNGFERSNYAVMLGREYMSVINMVAAALVYVIMRRLKFNRVIASIAVLLFACSPLAIYYHRMVFLDNIQVFWMLAAMAFAVSPRRSLASAIGAGLCLTLSTLSKETGGIAIVVILVLLWQNLPKGRYFRAKGLFLFISTYFMTSAFFVGMAILKGELIPGKGHVSLTGALWWQMFGRGGTGSILDPHSVTRATAEWWLSLDNWMPVIALLLSFPGLAFNRTRAVAIGYLIQTLLLLRHGYTPQAFIVQVIPFAALLIAGILGELCRWLKISRDQPKWIRIRKRTVNVVGLGLAACILGSFTIQATPQWNHGISISMARDSAEPYREVVNWIDQNVPKNAHLVVDDNLWVDLKSRGFTHVDWFYKVDLDPAIKKTYPHGYRDVDYVVITNLPRSLLENLPIVVKAVDHSGKPKVFQSVDMQYLLYQVKHTSTKPAQ